MARVVIGVVNFVMLAFAIIACVLIWVSKDKNSWTEFDVTSKENLPFILMIIIAAFAILASLVGFFILCCKNICWRMTYLVLIIIAIILEVVGIVIAFKSTESIIDSIGEVWDSMEGKNLEIRNSVEGELKCCGWKTFNVTNCNVTSQQTGVACYDKLKDSIDGVVLLVGYVVIGIVVVEVIILLLAIYLVCKSRRENVCEFLP